MAMPRILTEAEFRSLLERAPGAKTQDAPRELTRQVSEILEAVRVSGQSALQEFTLRFDGVRPDPTGFLCPVERILEAPPLEANWEKALQNAIANINTFHAGQAVGGFSMNRAPGLKLGEHWIPLERVGCYIPGGSAPLVSTLLMTVIPARQAGVREIVVATPPSREGGIHPAILRACRLLEVRELLMLGGAQAIGALAYGFDQFARVQKIVGPGNRYVTEAKRQVYGTVDIDMLAGPSEVCIVADATAHPERVAVDMLSQLEHDPDSVATALSPDLPTLENTLIHFSRHLETLPRRSIVEQALPHAHLVHCRNLESALELANRIAPEHLELMVEGAESLTDRVFRSGAVFLGHATPVAVGDFFGGTNHVLPTAGRAAFSSPLGVYDFYRRSQYLWFSEEQLCRVGLDIELLARMEGLEAHRRSVAVRRQGSKTDTPPPTDT